MKAIHRNDSVHNPRTRDAALRRLSRTSRWLLAGSAVLTGVLTDVAANAFPGHAKTKPTGGNTARKDRADRKHKPLSPPARVPEMTATEQTPPPPAETTQVAPAEETPVPEQTAPAPAPEAAPESTPVEETREPAPAPEEPVVSGGS